MALMHRPDWLRVLQLFNGFENPQPHHLAGRIALCREGIGPFHGLNGGAIAVLVCERFCGAPDVKVGGQSSITTTQ